jgi:hypothetical protein
MFRLQLDTAAQGCALVVAVETRRCSEVDQALAETDLGHQKKAAASGHGRKRAEFANVKTLEV